MTYQAQGNLTVSWPIPAYLQGRLHVASDSNAEEKAPAEGPHGTFALDEVPSRVIVYWRGEAEEAALTSLPWHAESLAWDGSVKVGGYVDAIHLAALPGMLVPVSLVYVGGQPLRPDVYPYPRATTRTTNTTTLRPDFHASLDSAIPESTTPWLITDDGLARAAREAMIYNLRMHCFGRMADADSGWSAHFTLPILLEALTVFAP